MSGYHADGEALTTASRELTVASDAVHSASVELDRAVGGVLGPQRLTAAVTELVRSASAELATSRQALAESARQVAAANSRYQDADREAQQRLRSPESGTR